jgi:hypothetical protein
MQWIYGIGFVIVIFLAVKFMGKVKDFPESEDRQHTNENYEKEPEE